MDNLDFCHAMEQFCRERIDGGSPHKGLWENEMKEWQKRWHIQAAEQFQGVEATQATDDEPLHHLVLRCTRLKTIAAALRLCEMRTAWLLAVARKAI